MLTLSTSPLPSIIENDQFCIKSTNLATASPTTAQLSIVNVVVPSSYENTNIIDGNINSDGSNNELFQPKQLITNNMTSTITNESSNSTIPFITNVIHPDSSDSTFSCSRLPSEYPVPANPSSTGKTVSTSAMPPKDSLSQFQIVQNDSFSDTQNSSMSSSQSLDTGNSLTRESFINSKFDINSNDNRPTG